MTHAAASAQTISVEHITIRSNRSFEEVRDKLETLVPRIDDGIFTLLRYGESERTRRELEASPPLMIFGQRNHGALLSIAGLESKALQYDIGNPLTASKMTRHRLSAGLYAPIRVLLSANGDGVVAIEYDRPASVFGQFGDDEVTTVAQRLDRDLLTVLESAAS